VRSSDARHGAFAVCSSVRSVAIMSALVGSRGSYPGWSSSVSQLSYAAKKKPHGTTPSGGCVEANPYFLCGVIPSSRAWSPPSPFTIIRVPLSSDRKSRIRSFLVVFLSVQRHVICRAVGYHVSSVEYRLDHVVPEWDDIPNVGDGTGDGTVDGTDRDWY
jgi:hypothetical protein